MIVNQTNKAAETMLRHLWGIRANIGFVLFVLITDILCFMWVSGFFIVPEQTGSQLQKWSSPGILSFPIAIQVILTLVAILVVLITQWGSEKSE